MKVSDQLRAGSQVRTAGESAFDYILHHREVMDTQEALEADEQVLDLFTQVCSKLSRKLSLSSGESEALSRILQVSENRKKWQPDLIRNNVFKAANALGIKLPSGMF